MGQYRWQLPAVYPFHSASMRPRWSTYTPHIRHTKPHVAIVQLHSFYSCMNAAYAYALQAFMTHGAASTRTARTARQVIPPWPDSSAAAQLVPQLQPMGQLGHAGMARSGAADDDAYAVPESSRVSSPVPTERTEHAQGDPDLEYVYAGDAAEVGAWGSAVLRAAGAHVHGDAVAPQRSRQLLHGRLQPQRYPRCSR